KEEITTSKMFLWKLLAFSICLSFLRKPAKQFIFVSWYCTLWQSVISSFFTIYGVYYIYIIYILCFNRIIFIYLLQYISAKFILNSSTTDDYTSTSNTSLNPQYAVYLFATKESIISLTK